MIVGYDPKSRQAKCFGDDPCEGRQWCYGRRFRLLYEIDGRRSFKPGVELQLRTYGRLITTGHNGPRGKA